ncbi:nucleotidyltransferase domain-containing protein [Enterococcus innesii]|uniref:nucleotidyltransferase family protein n=1 Tax=Enterococcus innesii TaxID=2839759 RepID=UPI001C1E2E36|nr:nucleotidyltransferase domain-containing protein [Enterococcus innesii]MEB5917760.1 nucleotidyltransferase domain-containing protein [Enterococcus innesii]
MMYTLTEIKQIVLPIAKKYGVAEMYLFGSYARGEADEQSDLDFAVKEDASGYLIDHYFSFVEELETAFQKEIDLIFLDSVNESATRFANRFAPRFEKDKVKVA